MENKLPVYHSFKITTPSIVVEVSSENLADPGHGEARGSPSHLVTAESSPTDKSAKEVTPKEKYPVDANIPAPSAVLPPAPKYQHTIQSDHSLRGGVTELPKEDFQDTLYFGRNIQTGIPLEAYVPKKYYDIVERHISIKKEYGPLKTKSYVSKPVFISEHKLSERRVLCCQT